MIAEQKLARSKIATEKRNEKLNEAVSEMNNILNVKFTVIEDLIDQKQFGERTSKTVCDEINANNLTIKEILEYMLKNKKNKDMSWFVKFHTGHKVSIGKDIGKTMVDAKIIKYYKSQELSGINGLAKMALEILKRQEV